METKSFNCKTVGFGEDGRTVVGLAAVTGVIDAGNDLIWRGAFGKTVEERLGRIKHLWQHDNGSPPIATILKLEEIGLRGLPDDLRKEFPDATGGLSVERRYLDTPRGNEVLAGLKSDPPAITEMSFGYDPVKFDFKETEDGKLIRNLREVRLWDLSDVNWGMNEATRAQLKTALPFKDTGKAPESDSWDGPTLNDFTSESWPDLSDADKRRIMAHYTWSANVPPDTFGDLKLPHHRASGSGVGPAVWRGVAAAMGVLMGARGGANIPSSDLPACHSHLAKHYAQFDKEPPTLKTLLAVRALSDALEDYGQEDSVYQKMLELTELLRAEPQDALTLQIAQQKLLSRLAIQKRKIAMIRSEK